MKSAAALTTLIVALCLAACSPAPQELSGRPLVLQLGAKISTATDATKLDELRARIASSTLAEPVRAHLTQAVEAQRRLLTDAAEMDMNTRMQAVQAVLNHVDAASRAVE